MELPSSVCGVCPSLCYGSIVLEQLTRPQEPRQGIEAVRAHLHSTNAIYSNENTPMTTNMIKITRLNSCLGITRCTFAPKYVPRPMPGKAQRNSSITKGVH